MITRTILVASFCSIVSPTIPHIHSPKRFNEEFSKLFAKSRPERKTNFPLDFGCANGLLGTQPGKHQSLI